MIAGIITTPKRQEYLKELVGNIVPFVRELIIFNDLDLKGNTFNMKRCLKELTEKAEEDEEVLCLDDDMLPTDDWFNQFYELKKKVYEETKEKPNFFILFTRQRHLIKYKHQKYFYGLQRCGFYGCSFILINQKGIIEKVDAWLAGIRTSLDQKKIRHYDNVFQEYLIQNKIKFVISVPTLFEHVGIKSSLKHSIGKSICFLK